MLRSFTQNDLIKSFQRGVFYDLFKFAAAHYNPQQYTTIKKTSTAHNCPRNNQKQQKTTRNNTKQSTATPNNPLLSIDIVNERHINKARLLS